MTCIIRTAEHRDIPSLARLLETLFAIEADFACDTAKQAAGLALLLESHKDCLLVAERDGSVVGMCSVQTVISTAEGGRVGWVEDVVVAATHRGQGIGRALLAHAEDWAIRHGLTRLQLLADRHNAAALDFYAHSGWHRTDLIALRTFPTAQPDPAA